jgi:hypothetical protein
MYTIQSIIWMKNVTDAANNGAYLNAGEVFNLHFPNRHRTNAGSPSPGELILLFQRIDRDIKFTHIVTPEDNRVDNEPKNARHGVIRKVRTVASCTKAPFISRFETLFSDIGFGGISQGNAIRIANIGQVQAQNCLLAIQQDIYSRFSDLGLAGK